jgi:hypothetical protein
VDVRPVNNRPDEVELFGEKGNVAERAEITLGAAGLKAESHPHVFDLW